jgi:ribonucleoside-diphosphate reductase subunit M1
MYYLRTRPAAAAIQFTVDQSILNKAKDANGDTAVAVTPTKGVKSPTSATSPNGRSLANGLNGVKRPASNGPPPSWMANKRNASSSGILTPTTPSAATPIAELQTPEPEVASPNVEVPPATPDTTAVTGTATALAAPNVSFDGTDKEAKAAKAAAEDPEFAAALARQRERELEEAALMCSIENKDACMMCSG